MSIRVTVSGAAGRMGREVVRAVSEAVGIELVSAIDHHSVGQDSGEVAGFGPIGVEITNDLKAALSASRPVVMIDFTVPESAMGNILAPIEARASAGVGQ